MTVLTGPLGRVDRVAISPGGEYVAAAGGTEQRLVVWAIRQPDQPRHVLPVLWFHERPWHFGFVPGSGLLVVGDSEGVTAHEPDSAAAVWRIPRIYSSDPGVCGLDVSADGCELIVIFFDYFGSSRVQRWALNGRSHPVRGRGARGPEDTTRAVGFLPGTTAFVVAEDVYARAEPVDAPPPFSFEYRGRLRIVNGAGRTTQTLDTGSGSVHQLAVSPDGRFLAAQFPGSVLVWDTRAIDTPPRHLSQGPVTLTGVAFCPSGRYLAISGGSAVTLYETTTWQVARTYAWGGALMRAVCFSPAGGLVAAGSDAGAVVVWDLPSAEPAAAPDRRA